MIYPISEAPLIESLETAGFTLSDDPAKIDIVIASYDRTFTYQKLQIAFDAIWFEKRAMLVSTNPDRYCPFPGGGASRTRPASSPRSRRQLVRNVN